MYLSHSLQNVGRMEMDQSPCELGEGGPVMFRGARPMQSRTAGRKKVMGPPPKLFRSPHLAREVLTRG